MKIEGLNNDKNKVPVGMIDPGQCFRIDEKPQVFMMIDYANYELDKHIIREAVNIETGKRITILDGRKPVTPVCVEAIISEEV